MSRSAKTLAVLESFITAPYSAGSGSVVLAPGTGGVLVPVAGPFAITTVSGNQRSVFTCTGRTGDTLTGVAVADGTTDQYFPAGSIVEAGEVTSGGIGGAGTVTSIIAGAGLTGGTITTTGTIALSATGLTITQHGGAITTDAPSTGTVTCNLATSDRHQVTMAVSPTTFTFSNPAVGQTLVLLCIQGGAGSLTATWPGTVDWGAAGQPTLSTTVGKIDILTFFWDGSKYYGSVYGLGF